MNEIRVTIDARSLGLLLVLLVAGLAAFALLRKDAPVQAARTEAVRRTKTLVGTITRIEPPYLYVESSALGETREFAVIVNEMTLLMRFIPWAEGEREKAFAHYEKYVASLDLDSGDQKNERPKNSLMHYILPGGPVANAPPHPARAQKTRNQS